MLLHFTDHIFIYSNVSSLSNSTLNAIEYNNEITYRKLTGLTVWFMVIMTSRILIVNNKIF